MRKYIIPFILFFANFIFAAENKNDYHLDGSEMSMFWTVPFAGILLSIAIFPLIAPHFGIKTLVKYRDFGH